MSKKSFNSLYEDAQATPEYWADMAKLDVSVCLNGLLEQHEMSRAALARKIDASAPYVTKVLSGDENLTIETMAKIAHALGARLSISMPPKDADVRSLCVYQSVPATPAPADQFDWNQRVHLPTVKTAHG